MCADVQTKKVTEVKLLCIKIQISLMWTTHVTDLSKKVMKMAGLFGRTVGVLSKDTLRDIYHCVIYSHVRYCCTVWGQSG